MPGTLYRGVDDSIKADLSNPLLSNGGDAINEDIVPRIHGVVATSSCTAGGGTSSLFNHAHESHPNLLATI